MKHQLAMGGVLLVAALTCFAGLSALAQNANPTTPLGPGNTGTLGPGQGAPPAPSQKMLDSALTPETKQTLQDAMNSVNPATMVPAVNALDLGPGEAAEMDGTKASRIAFAQLPNSLRAALGGGTHRALTDSTGQ
jgi:hypothetical protein